MWYNLIQNRFNDFDVNAKHDLDLDFEIDQLASKQVAYDCAP